MLRPVVSNKGLSHLVPRALHPTMTELRQFDRIALARKDGIENRLATGSGDVAEHMMELQVHLTERLLHVQNVLGCHLEQAAAVPPQGTNGTDRIRWTEACPQQPYRVQILDPLAVGYVALASGHTLQIVRIDQINFEAALPQYLKQRDPVHPCRLHRHGLNRVVLLSDLCRDTLHGLRPMKVRCFTLGIQNDAGPELSNGTNLLRYSFAFS